MWSGRAVCTLPDIASSALIFLGTKSTVRCRRKEANEHFKLEEFPRRRMSERRFLTVDILLSSPDTLFSALIFIMYYKETGPRGDGLLA
ncbi:hypothetical protein BDV09DRAFT_85892 [Aspergillus tetrazonus]